MIKRVVVIVIVTMLSLGGLTLFALEADGVAEVETWNAQDSTERVTHIWYVQTDGSLFLEAGHPDNPWVKDLSQGQTLQLRGDGITGAYRFEMFTSQVDHVDIRERMRKKYGWRDVWISWVFDVEESVMIQVFRV